MDAYSFGGGVATIRKQVELRQCRDCGYITFTKYVICPRCKSEKWAPKLN